MGGKHQPTVFGVRASPANRLSGHHNLLPNRFSNRGQPLSQPLLQTPPWPLAQSDHLPGIANCRWCACATQIGQIFLHNRIYISLF